MRDACGTGCDTVSTETLEAQAVGGPEAVGGRLAAARAAKGWSIEAAAASLKVPAHVVSSLEGGQWQRLGAPVFVRGQLRSYARQLGIEAATLLGQAEVEQWVPVNLVSHVRAPRLRRWTDGVGSWLGYLMAVVAVVALVMLLLRYQWGSQAEVASLDDFAIPVAVDDSVDASAGSQALPLTVAESAPVESLESAAGAEASAVTAPMATVSAAVSPGAGLELTFAGQSWIEILGRDGAVIERAMVAAGQSRHYPTADVGRVLLGNSAQITARLNGAPLDLSTLRRSNVARFTVSSDGSASPVAH